MNTVLTVGLKTDSCRDDSDGVNIYLAGATVGGNWGRQRAARGRQTGFLGRHSGVRGVLQRASHLRSQGASPNLGAAVGASVQCVTASV
jgi:hypothetical protein